MKVILQNKPVFIPYKPTESAILPAQPRFVIKEYEIESGILDSMTPTKNTRNIATCPVDDKTTGVLYRISDQFNCINIFLLLLILTCLFLKYFMRQFSYKPEIT
jgi:hypothetical protein